MRISRIWKRTRFTIKLLLPIRPVLLGYILILFQFRVRYAGHPGRVRSSADNVRLGTRVDQLKPPASAFRLLITLKIAEIYFYGVFVLVITLW